MAQPKFIIVLKNGFYKRPHYHGEHGDVVSIVASRKRAREFDSEDEARRVISRTCYVGGWESRIEEI